MANATAARHNNLQARLEQVIGTGAGKTGYGQGLANYGPSPSSYQVSNLQDSNLNVISAMDINSIYADMLRVRVHQIGTEPTEIAELVSELNVIAERTSFFVDDQNNTTSDPDGNKKGVADYESLMTSIELDKFLMHPSQSTLETALTNTRSSVWNGMIYHEFTVSFIDENHRRHYFNSGGSIQIGSAITGFAPLSKGADWASLLSSVGTISINHNSTSSTGSGVGSNIGNYQLTSLYQLIFQKAGTGEINGIYTGNLYKVFARITDVNSIQFRVEYNDVSTGSIIDVNVDGILENQIQLNRADSIYISVPKPVTTTNVGLSAFATPEPIYSLSSSSPGVAEGNAVTIQLTTVNVPNGTVVPYNIQGVTSADISGLALSGNFVVQNNTASFTINMANDLILKENDSEVLTVRLANGSSRINVNIVDTTPDPVYTLTTANNVTELFEGSNVTFNLNVKNLPTNSNIPYTISGVTSADIENNSLVGIFTINSSGNASLTVPLTIDNFEENETLTLSIDGTSISKSVLIKDPSYTLLSNNSRPAESDTITITLRTDQLPNNTVIPYTISGVSSADISGAPLTGTFTLVNNTAQASFTFAADAIVDPDEQFTLALDNGKASITLTITDSVLPTSANRTCIAVIDEASSSRTTLASNWTSFRTNWPNRPFYLLQPGRTRPELYEPAAFVSDPLTEYSQVIRDGGTPPVSDWYTICNIDQLPDGSKLALFIDTSGSMRLSTVQASYDLFKQKIQARNMTIVEVFNGNENWILPFNTILD